MAFYFSQGNSAERIDDIRPPDQLSQATDDVRRSQNSNRRRADPRPAKQTSRREALRARLIGDQGSSDRTRAAHWQQTTTADPLSDTSEVLINSEGRVSYGTWHGLISYLTQVHRPSDTYTQAFFLTFRTFATPADLADALATRVRELAAVRAHSAGAQRTRQSILHNVFLAIKHWYDQYWWPHADAAVLPFLCSFLVNEYLPLSHGSAEAKECHQLLVRIAEKNDNVNLRALPTNAVLKSMFSARKQPTDSQQLQLQRRRSESARKSRAYNEDSARPHSGGQDAGARDAARASGRPEPPESPRDSGSSQSEGSHGRHGFWSRLFGKLHRSSQSSRVHSPFSDSGSSLFASPDHSVPGNDDHDDMESVIPVQVLEPQPHKRRHLMHRQRDERDSGVQVSHDSESEPDISDLLMATVGMDLSLEAYRRNTHIYQISPVDVACQLTIIESSCYCQIEPYELVNKEFSRGSDSHAVNVRQMSRWCTQITRWASVTILSEPTADRRCRLLKYFIDLGIQLLALKNFDAVMAVKAAVYSAAVMRLKRTWSLLPKKYTIMCRRLHEATDPDRNYSNYRRMLRRSQPPLLPFLGLYLTDITFLDDGNPTYRRFEQPDELVKSASRQLAATTGTAEPSTEPPVRLTGQTCALFAHRKDVDLNSRSILINFEKSYRLAAIIQEMQKFQVEYSGNFTMAIPGLQRYLIEQWESCDREGYDDDKIYSLSLRCEPRAAPCPSPADLNIRPQPAGMRFSRLLPGSAGRQQQHQQQKSKDTFLSNLSDIPSDS